MSGLRFAEFLLNITNGGQYGPLRSIYFDLIYYENQYYEKVFASLFFYAVWIALILCLNFFFY